MSKFKVGDKVKINKYPGYWSSRCNPNSPCDIEYPIVGYVEKIEQGYNHVGVSACGYGWSMQALEEVAELVEEAKPKPKPKPKFKVGDKVRVRDTPNVRCFSSAHDSIGEVFTLNKDDARQMNDIYNDIIHLNNNRFRCNYVREDFELVEQGCEPCGTTISSGNVKEFIDKATYSTRSALEPWGIYKVGLDMGFEEEYKLSSNKKTIMSKITNFVKNSLLTADEKLMRKYGLKDEYGEFTNEAEDLVIAKLIKENEAYLIEVAKGLEAEEKANK